MSLMKKPKSVIEMCFDWQEGGSDSPLKVAERLLSNFKGKHYVGLGSSDRYVVNIIFSLVNLIFPNLTMQTPYIRVKAKRPIFKRVNSLGQEEEIDNNEAARILEPAINEVLRDTDAWQAMNEAIQDSLFYPFGVTKCGYALETYSEEDIDYIKDENPFCSRLKPSNFGFHSLATNTGNAEVLAEKIVTTKDEYKDNKDYTQFKDLDGSLPKEMREKLLGKKALIDNYLTLYEVHYQRKAEIRTYEGAKYRIAEKKKNPYKFKGSHYCVIKLAGDNDEFEGIPLLSTIEDLARAANKVFTLMMRHMEIFPGQVIQEDGALDGDDVVRFQNGEQGSILTVQDITKVKKEPPLPMGGEYFNLLNLIFMIIDKILGVPDFQSSGSSTRKSATQATFEQGDASVRREYFLGIIKKFILENVKRVASLMQQNFDVERMVKLSGKSLRDGEKVDWIKYTKEDIQGEYDFDFDINELRAINEVELQQLVNALNILAAHPMLQPILATLDTEKVAKELFTRMNINIESIQKTGGDAFPMVPQVGGPEKGTQPKAPMAAARPDMFSAVANAT